MHPHVKQLLELQKVDQEISYLRKDLDSLPAEEQKRKKKLEELDRAAAEKKERATKIELDSRALEKAIKQGDDEVKKLTDRLALVRNNAEYQATLFQIESVKKDRDQTQEECLKLLDALEGLKTEAAAATRLAAEEHQVFAAFQTEADKLRRIRGVEVAAVQQRRNATAEGIPPDLLADYTRLYEVRNGMAVCSVERNYCQGCYTNITTHDMARLIGGSTIVQCGSCQRILYLQQ